MPKNTSPGDQQVQMDRRWKNRRSEDAGDGQSQPKVADRVREFQAPKRRKQRRRQIDPTTCERDYNAEEIAFMRALDDYKRSSGRMFPTCSEILEVVRKLGYTKLSEEELLLLDSRNEAKSNEEASSDPNDVEEDVTELEGCLAE